MAQKITISVSDSLFERLQAVKESIAISRICQEVIDREVAIQELLRKGNDMEQVIERLKKEKEQYGEQYRQMGREHGIEDAKKLSYDELISLANTQRIYECQPGLDDYDPQIVYGNECWQGWLEDEIKNLDEYQNGGFDMDAYVGGWLEGVVNQWEEIKGEL